MNNPKNRIGGTSRNAFTIKLQEPTRNIKRRAAKSAVLIQTLVQRHKDVADDFDISRKIQQVVHLENPEIEHGRCWK